MNPPPPPPPPAPAQKKSRLWAILGVILVILLVGGSAVVYFGSKFVSKQIATQKERRARMADLEKTRREILEEANASMKDGKVDGAADRLNKISESMGSAADAASGAEKQGLRVVQRITQSMAPALSSYEAATKEMQAAEVLRVDTIESRDTIAARTQIVKKFNDANDTLSKVLAGLESKVRLELENEGFPVRDREKFVSGFVRSANVDLAMKVRGCDTEIAEGLQKVLALLDREWGAWKIENGVIAFTKTAVAEEYNDLITKVNEIAERQSVAQQELLNRASKPSPLR